MVMSENGFTEATLNLHQAPIPSPPSKLFARDIVRYSDVELDQYLEATRRLELLRIDLWVANFNIKACRCGRPRKPNGRIHPEIEVRLSFVNFSPK